jgi:hypothetical protein
LRALLPASPPASLPVAPASPVPAPPPQLAASPAPAVQDLARAPPLDRDSNQLLQQQVQGMVNWLQLRWAEHISGAARAFCDPSQPGGYYQVLGDHPLYIWAGEDNEDVAALVPLAQGGQGEGRGEGSAAGEAAPGRQHAARGPQLEVAPGTRAWRQGPAERAVHLQLALIRSGAESFQQAFSGCADQEELGREALLAMQAAAEQCGGMAALLLASPVAACDDEMVAQVVAAGRQVQARLGELKLQMGRVLRQCTQACSIAITINCAVDLLLSEPGCELRLQDGRTGTKWLEGRRERERARLEKGAASLWLLSPKELAEALGTLL